ncbi:MAG: sulfate adenylyltransferase [Nitrosopumilaceae archaeon]|nr:sulfate adenylyltransferase [Nitrosopumilaceae archaeon]NIU01905.1 sulfate adenylyltransferase [Nitrosopumilaceae archaeon]NIU88309.1 sulfate adenylyltransferase [Nitrosopumilaceae archaeon]NIV66601.1 sulfate adenylyltransferase [Nitrosopumilaceae archaeon]NIX62506.1 sulfate adenylyltransferase [Nitrosopumilaceae archaeon]
MSEDFQGISPHGGRLVNRVSETDPTDLESITINDDLANDVENIADGIFSPLEGFVGKQDFENIVTRGRLSNDLPWTIPIVFDVDENESKRLKEAGDILLKDSQGLGFAILHVEETYSFEKEKAVMGIYGTKDSAHPGVAKTHNLKDYLVGGKIDYIQRPEESEIRKHRMTPRETRKAFSDAGWKKIVAFQTRNPPHVAHEMLQKTAITTRDGVFVNPLIGKKKSGDFVDEVIIKSYETMIKHYYPENRCKLGTLHTEMRYAGPKEAIHHAILRQNYGCTHIIIGRDHAGVGNFYDPFAAHKVFDDYPDLEIEPVFFPAFFYCKKCLTFTNPRACPHEDSREQVSGTMLRQMIQDGKSPSEFILRPEVSQVILNHPSPFVD